MLDPKRNEKLDLDPKKSFRIHNTAAIVANDWENYGPFLYVTTVTKTTGLKHASEVLRTQSTVC
jgi:hypothetical protein